MTIFNKIPTDIIIRIGKFLDYDSTINWNRTLLPTDRVVHRKFTKDEANWHERSVWRKCIQRKVDAVGNSDKIRKRSRNMMNLLCMFKTTHRASILVKTCPLLHNGVIEKCILILDKNSSVIQAACKTDKKRLRKIARRVLDDLLRVTPKPMPSKLINVLPTTQ